MPSRCAEVRRARPLLGTFVEIVVSEPDGDPAGAIGAAFATIAEVQRRMSFHDPASTLSRLNREAARRAIRVDAWTFAVLQAAREMHRVSGGVFDVTMASQGGGSFSDVELTASGCVRFHAPGLRIDLGGIAKGFAVDQAVATLLRLGIRCGLVNAGGDLRAFGDAAFPVSIRHPDDPSATLTTFALRDAAVATSAHYFSDRPAILHPCGTPCALPRSVTVHAAEAMHADALTKVVMLSAEAALPVLTHFGADALFVSTEGEVACNDGWNATLHFPT